MSTDAQGDLPRPPAPRVPIATLLRALLPALAATVIVVYFLARASSSKPTLRPDGMMRIALVQKDSAFHPIPATRGGASGEVLYAPTGPALHFVLHAFSLPTGVRYALEIQADEAIYSVASYSPDARGQLTIDTTLTRFQEGECVGANYAPPRPIAGKHVLKFRIKRDGSPTSGTMPGVLPSAPGAQLPCHGNGDGKYEYLLLENEAGTFTGTSDAAPNGHR